MDDLIKPEDEFINWESWDDHTDLSVFMYDLERREIHLFEEDSVRELAQFYDDLEREEHMRITNKQAIFLTAIVDFIGGLIAVLVGQFAPEWSAFALSIWGICQPLALAIIGYLVVEPVRELLQALRRLK